MSLLLQALQKAARSRESSNDEAPAVNPEPLQEPSFEFDADVPSPDELGGEELTLADDDDLFEPEAQTRPEPIQPAPTRPGIGGGHTPALVSAAASAHAATILRATEERSAGWLDRVRDRPVHAFAALAGVFLVCYGAYVYLQIFHPGILRGDFLSKPPLKAKSPPPRPSPISQAPAAKPPELAAPPSSIAQAPASPAQPGPAGANLEAPAASAGRGPTAVPQTKLSAAPPQETPAESGTERVKPPKATAERSKPKPAAPRVRRDTQPREELGGSEPSDALEDTVAVRQPATPAATGTTLVQAWQALQSGQFVQAETLYHKVEEADPQNVDAALGLAAIATQRGDTELATQQYTRALELEPRNPTAQAGLISLLGQADPQLSESRLKELIARDPSANLYFALGNLYARSTQWAQAQQAYFQAYQLQPDNPDYAYNLAVGLEHLSKPKLALTYYRQALELGSLKGHASFDTARVQERVGQLTARTGSE